MSQRNGRTPRWYRGFNASRFVFSFVRNEREKEKTRRASARENRARAACFLFLRLVLYDAPKQSAAQGVLIGKRLHSARQISERSECCVLSCAGIARPAQETQENRRKGKGKRSKKNIKAALEFKAPAALVKGLAG